MSKLPVTGVIYLRAIHEARIGLLEKAFMAMLKDICGEDCLNHIILVTTQWSSEVTENYKLRESELLSKPDSFGSVGGQKVQVRRLNNQYSSDDAQYLVQSCTGLPSVTFQIQREVVDEAKALGETQAGLRLGLDTAKLLELEKNASDAGKVGMLVEL